MLRDLFVVVSWILVVALLVLFRLGLLVFLFGLMFGWLPVSGLF